MSYSRSHLLHVGYFIVNLTMLLFVNLIQHVLATVTNWSSNCTLTLTAYPTLSSIAPERRPLMALYLEPTSLLRKRVRALTTPLLRELTLSWITVCNRRNLTRSLLSSTSKSMLRRKYNCFVFEYIIDQTTHQFLANRREFVTST